MKSKLDQLIQLQKIDTQLSSANTQISNRPIQLENAKLPLVTAQAELDKTKTLFEASSKKGREKEQDLLSHEAKIEKLRSRTSEIKTNKEYHALLQELEVAKRGKGNLEEELLLLMEEQEIQGNKVREQEKVLKQSETDFRAREHELSDQAKDLDQALSKLIASREEISSQIQESLLRNYQTLKNSRKDLAVVPVINGACGGCHINLPPQLVAEVKSENEILTCSHCHRILYFSKQDEKNDRPVEAKTLPSVTDSP